MSNLKLNGGKVFCLSTLLYVLYMSFLSPNLSTKDLGEVSNGSKMHLYMTK